MTRNKEAMEAMEKVTDQGLFSLKQFEAVWKDLEIDDVMDGVLIDSFMGYDYGTQEYIVAREQAINCWQSMLRVYTSKEYNDIITIWDNMREEYIRFSENWDKEHGKENEIA